MESPELQMIDEIGKGLSAFAASQTVQLIEIQALLNVLIDFERRRLIDAGVDRQEVNRSIQDVFEKHRKAVYTTVQARLQMADPRIDLGPLQ
jgi:hypothetical protein